MVLIGRNSVFFVFVFFLSTQFNLANAQEKIPKAVQEARSAVFQIIFLPAPDKVKQYSKEAFEALDRSYNNGKAPASTLGFWFQKLNQDCGDRKTCEFWIDRERVNNQIAYSYATAFLAKDARTLITAPHVWVSMDEKAKRGQVKREEVIDKPVHFVLIDQNQNIVFDTRREGSSAVVTAFANAVTMQSFYPQFSLIAGEGIDGMEFLAIRLNKAFQKKFLPPFLGDPNTLKKQRLYSLGIYDQPDTGKFGGAASILACRETDQFADSLEQQGRGQSELRRMSELYRANTVSFDVEAQPGMSGGPVLNDRGEVVSLNSFGRKHPVFASGQTSGQLSINNMKVVGTTFGPSPRFMKVIWDQK